MKHILLYFFLFLFTSMTVTAQVGIGGPENVGLMDQDPEQANIKVFPNPATNFIGLSNYKGIAQIAIYNVVGRKLRTFTVIDDRKYSIADLPNGMYLVQLVNHNNKIIKTHRMSKR
ncbi:MAG: T9SS type A sorting domain-containing protein [Bacteroidota bacterium]